jgi:hypothetical protein
MNNPYVGKSEPLDLKGKIKMTSRDLAISYSFLEVKKN